MKYKAFDHYSLVIPGATLFSRCYQLQTLHEDVTTGKIIKTHLLKIED